MGKFKGYRFACILKFAPAFLVGLALSQVALSQQRILTTQDLKPLSWRSVGPANMGGRIASIAQAPSDPKTIFLGYATGGLWKSTNNGTTFSPIFDTYETSSIGAVGVADAPESWSGWADEELAEEADLSKLGRSKIVWVGTGEGNSRNSSSWGHGVYRSTDGGASFEHKGLEETNNIPALVIDPRDPDVCYIGALGHLWGANKERGIYKTSDGGDTWDAILQIDDHTGCVDLVMDPSNPDILYAAMYARQRTPWSYTGMSETGGIFKSVDAGRTWNKLTDGLPTRVGRIGLDIFDGDSKIVMAVIESDEGGMIGGAFNSRTRAGGVFRSEDGGETWRRTLDLSPRSFYFSLIRIDPEDDQRVYLPGTTIYVSDDGGDHFRGDFGDVMHLDHHAMVIDPRDPEHLLMGNDGGFYVSWDRGATWDFHNTMATGQFYNVSVDESDPYRIGGGLQDNGSWIGPSETITEARDFYMGHDGAITNHDWKFFNGGDGFHVEFDPEDSNIVYAESQGGNISRSNLATGEQWNIKPQALEGAPAFRFNWNAPFFLSPHDSTTIYLGGNCVFKLTKGGDAWERISDDLSTKILERVITVGSDAETYGTVVSLAESPLQQGLLWAGTDDGLIHISANDGDDWKDVTPLAVKGRYISKIEASHQDAETAYIAVDGHRSDSFEPLLLMTTDAGRTWNDITSDIPTGHTTKVIREDPRNAAVLYVGTERAAYVSINKGDSWIKLNGKSLPTIGVDDLKIQSRTHDLVAGTHGRSVWILDDASPLSQLSQDIVESEFHVFDP
ncbi:MAG: hypothetical protein O7G85_00880, partial [Planctomycetota bacterium]|nr:hypothetical protein [Planctomycetota bacterium]